MEEQVTTPPQSTPAPVAQPAAGNTIKTSLALGIAAVTLIIGLLGGYVLVQSFAGKPQGEQKPEAQENNTTLVLPDDASLIQSCSDRRGSLYVKAADIPVGPIYMVNNGKVIGLEYMLSKDEFLQGKSYKDLKALGLKVDHVNIGLLSQGHEGYTNSHYHVDMYTVGRSVEEAIKCQTTTSPTASMSAMPGMPMATGSASKSATHP